MPREVPEWVGKTPDSAIPPRVKAMVYLAAEGYCAKCTRFIDGAKLIAQYDHAIPLIIGGENRQSNLQLLCEPCHKEKTKLDVKIKAKVARVQKRHLRIKTSKSRPMPGSRASGWKRKMDGTVERRT